MTKTSPEADVRQVKRIVAPLIVTPKGHIARLETSLTPHEAQIEDLVFLRKVLNRAGIPFLLVRDNESRPVLAVDQPSSTESSGDRTTVP